MAFNDALRRLPVSILRRPSTFKQTNKKPEYANLYLIRNHVNNLFREERIELPRYNVLAVRPYAERLLQLACVEGLNDEYANRMLNWWMQERDLLYKVFKVYVPRYRDSYLDGRLLSFTSMYRLPDVYEGVQKGRREYVQRWKLTQNTVFELKGNPYPPVIAHPTQHKHSLTNVLLTSARISSTSSDSATPDHKSSTSEPESSDS